MRADSEGEGVTRDFADCARFPAPGDNVAIATRRLEAGSAIRHDGETFPLSHTVLEGHRFAAEPIAAGAELLSWGLPFGRATRALAPGEYVCNDRMLEALGGRGIDFELPSAANFEDVLQPHAFDAASFVAGEQVASHTEPGTFRGFRRAGGRGVGTRNVLAVLGVTSADGAFAEALAARARAIAERNASIDGVVAVAHTEGGGSERPLNLDFVFRALAGFLVHPNVGAVLLIDHGSGAYSGDELLAFAREAGYPLEHTKHHLFRVERDWESSLQEAQALLAEWEPTLAACARTDEPLAELKLALQCGGSDAFSGVSGNALAGWVAKELIRHGGAANLAETDELIGAEPYVLSNVRDAATAARFLEKIQVFKDRVGLHGASAEGNPSGGNNFRGLYNIALKSIGAARKKDPDVRLDRVLDYAEPMDTSGFHFMDSPGNDLESIAGQVASGANLILFITGNGSITNFPFVPTLKFVTTTPRFELLSDEMDVNAGRYNDGESMDALGRDTFEQVVRVASGERSKGEAAGHAQVSLWRAWRQVDASGLRAEAERAAPTGEPLTARAAAPAVAELELWRTERGTTADVVGLVMPTSLCSGQVARLIAQRLNEREERPGGVSRFVALVHTEGCGSVNAEHLYLETLLGHLRHPFTRRAVLLEHGCEKTHNDAVGGFLAERGESTERLGLASVQLDGGIDAVTERVVDWFDAALAEDGDVARGPAGAAALRVGFVLDEVPDEDVGAAIGALAASIVAAGGSVVFADNAFVRASDPLRSALLESEGSWRPTLAYGQHAERAGLHVMETPTEDPVEAVTGLGGTGVEVMVACVARHPLRANPMVPLVQCGLTEKVAAAHAGDLDLDCGDPAGLPTALLAKIADVASGRARPRLSATENAGFQITRGALGISL